MCRGVWDAACYIKYEWDDFPVLGRYDLDNSLMGVNKLQSDDPHMFQIGQNGDHIMVPFQCNLCIFLNIKNWRPQNASHQNWLLLLSIRRVILDSFWSRESSTVVANFREANREEKIKATFGLEYKILEQ